MSFCDHVHGHIYDFIMDRKLGKSATETTDLIHQVYGNETISHARCFKWHACSKRGRTSLDNNMRSGRPSSSSSPDGKYGGNVVTCA